MPKSTTPRSGGKSAKPHPDLWLHPSGRWCKKHKGRAFYFGKATDPPEEVAARYLAARDDWAAGREPRPRGDGLTVADLVNAFLTHKQAAVDTAELSPRTFERYYRTCGLLVATFGRNRSAADLRPEDFQTLRAVMAKRWGPIAVGNEIQIVRCVFRFGFEAELLATSVRFGPGFRKPTAKTIRKARAARGPRMFAPEEVHTLLAHAGTNMRAMLLLGLNAALGNTDVALLPIRAIDLKTGWLDYARSKTGIPRRIPLWPETVDAIRRVLAGRPTPKSSNSEGLLFIGPRGEDYVGNHRGYRVTAEFRRVARAAGVQGRAFYDSRRTFLTIAEGSADLAAVQHVMGHSPPGSDMSAIYRQRIPDARLVAVVDHVRRWLFESKTKK